MGECYFCTQAIEEERQLCPECRMRLGPYEGGLMSCAEYVTLGKELRAEVNRAKRKARRKWFWLNGARGR